MHKAWIEIYPQNTCTFLIGLLACVVQIDFLRVTTGAPTAQHHNCVIGVMSPQVTLQTSNVKELKIIQQVM